MRVELKKGNGWKVGRSKVDSHDDVRYGIVHETKIKKIAVLVRGPGDYKCSYCREHDPETNCKHEQAVADYLRRIPA